MSSSSERRRFLRQLLTGSSAIAVGSIAGCNDYTEGQQTPYQFTHGVASGDPLSDRVILWTRVVPFHRVALDVNWEVAADADFQQIISTGTGQTDAARDYTVKVDATGLQAGKTYFYRFYIEDSYSPVGQTRSLPRANVDTVKLAVFSCCNYPAGYFHAYAAAAQRDDLQAVVHLGDYIYEYGAEPGAYASADAADLGRVSLPAHELISLDDYRQRYAQYRSDPDLQALHAKVPFICVWDDHELANDAWQAGAENHDASEGDFLQRRAHAIKAWQEWLPVREVDSHDPLRIYRSFDFGHLLSLHMLDTRVIGRDEPLAYSDYIDSSGVFAAESFAADVGNSTRQLLGVAQTQWLQEQLAISNARWQVLGQQVLMGQMYLPAPVLTPDPTAPTVSFSEYATIATAFATYQAIAAQLEAAGQAITPANLLAAGLTEEQLAIVNDPTMQAIINAPSIPYNLDAWDGYVAARETVYGLMQAFDHNMIVLSGDTHNAWANELYNLAGQAVGVEFATAGVSSPGLEAVLTDIAPAALSASLGQLIPTLKYSNTSERGYMVLTVTSDTAQADWYFVSSVKQQDYTLKHEQSLQTRLDERALLGE